MSEGKEKGMRWPRLPAHPERVCWGCEKLCPASDLACGNGTIRTPHPSELFGSDWDEWGNDTESGANAQALATTKTGRD